MMNKAHFRALVDRAMAIGGRTHMRPVIEKELLHYDILFALDKEDLLDQLTFQGGTSLRLCYGSPRFSEDLDFVGGRGFATTCLLDMKSCVEHYLGSRYGLEVSVKEPKALAQDPEHQDIKVDKWQISVVTVPEHRDVPRQRIKIEVVNIPAYSRQPETLQHNYDFLPDGYSDILIMVESLDEMMADKLISLVNCQRYIRHRDIWDLRWLKQQRASINADFIKAKISDYKVIDYPQKVDEMMERLPNIIHGKAFREQMSRFIPMDVQERTLQKNKFFDFLLNETKTLLADVKAIVSVGEPDDEFRM